jgi:hypothetical protein
MKRNIWIGIFSLWTAASLLGATNESPLPRTSEVIDALKAHYVDRDKLDQRLLNDATVSGILQALGGGARLLTAAEAASNALPVVESTAELAEPLARAEVIEPDIGYIRFTDVMGDTAAALDVELSKFAEQKVTAYVLDLRYADGTNYAAAVAVAGRFLPAGVELFTLKQAGSAARSFRTQEVPRLSDRDLVEAPLMLLVNAETRGSAEVLAGALRAQDRGIVIGGSTAGGAVAWQDVPVGDGRVLRLAAAKIALANGAEIFPSGVVPDISVKIDPKIEHKVVFNVQSNVTLTASLQPVIKKKSLTEADLVKAFRGEPLETPSLTLANPTAQTNTLNLGVTSDLSTNEAAEATGSEEVRDIVLQRAVDVMKGIRVFVSWQ